MNLQIRDPEVRKRAEKLARIENKSLTKAVGDAINEKLNRVERRQSVAEIAAEIAAELKAISKPGGHRMTKDEIDEMWWG